MLSLCTADHKDYLQVPIRVVRCHVQSKFQLSQRSNPVSRLLFGEEERAWYTLFVHALSPLVNCILLHFLFTCWNATLQSYTSCETHTGGFEVRNSITLTVTVCISLFEVIGELQSKVLHQSHAAAFSYRRDEHVNNYCKQRAECLRHFVIVHTEHGASFTWEKLACLMEVGATEQISTRISKFP